MKKTMLTIVAGLALALTTQAAQVDWSVGNNAVTWASTGLNTAPIGTEMYLVLDDYVAGITAAIVGETFSGSTLGVLDMATTANTKGAIAPNSTPDSALLQTGGTVYNYRVLVFDTVGGVPHYQFSAAIPITAYIPADPEYGEVKQVNFGATHFSTENWEAVPEPTSLALLALGVAAIGLRRKFRK